MRWQEILEGMDVAELGTINVPLYRNPSAEQVSKLVQKWWRLRGVEFGNDIWVWNAHDAVHVEVEESLLLPHQQCAEFMIQGGEKPMVLLTNNGQRLHDSAKLKHMMTRFPAWSFNDAPSSHAPSAPSQPWSPAYRH